MININIILYDKLVEQFESCSIHHHNVDESNTIFLH